MKVPQRIAAVIAIGLASAAISVSTSPVANAANFRPPAVDGWSWGE